jgi:hypothetical protein
MNPTKYNHTSKDNAAVDINNDTLRPPNRMDDQPIPPINPRSNHHQRKTISEQKVKARSLLISVVAQKMNNQTQQDKYTNRITGKSLQYHSISTRIQALKPTKTEICSTTIPMLFQSSHHPYTAFNNINSLNPQDLEYIMTTYCELFYPQPTKAMIKELKNSPDEEFKQMMQTPQTI